MKLKLLRKFYLGFIVLIGVFLISARVVKAMTPEEIVIHYYRYNNIDQDHNAWVWQDQPNPSAGSQHDFILETDHPNWLVTSVDLTKASYTGARRLGVIIKNKSGWDGVIREPGGDRFITIDANTEIIDNKYHFYFVQGDQAIYNTRPEIKDTIFKTYFNIAKGIVVEATGLGDWILKEDNVEIASGTSTTNQFTINPGGVIDITKRYTVEQTFADGGHAVKQVGLEKLYDTQEFTNAFYYSGTLGPIYTKAKTTFKVWSPTSENIILNLYHQGHPLYDNLGNKLAEADIEDTPYESIPMTKKEKGVWEAEFVGDLHGKYYTYTVINGSASNEIVDPYAYSLGANGLRGMILDFSKTNPTNWQNKRPNTITNWTDYIIYELHVRDFTTHSSWGGPKELAGTFLGLAQSGTTYTKGDVTVTTGLDHIAELGVNAIHILPFFDHGEVDETRLKDEAYMKNHAYNWGYMPRNFNSLEGSYSTNPFDGAVRVNEFKTMVQALHNKGIRLIMDVVYNHTSNAENSNFQYLVPNYYYRLNVDGSWSNGSGTGNETASDRPMFRKFMIDSISFWAKEYNISGFRFDLMALHDIKTMNDIEKALNQIDPTIVVYGEPWPAGETPLPDSQMSNTVNMPKLNVGSFSDASRIGYKDWIKGDRNNPFIAARVRYGLAGAAEIDGAAAETWQQSMHKEPWRIINYVSVHDGHTLRDFLFLNGKRGDDLKDLHKLANSFVLLSQGIPYLHGGVDMMHTKDVPQDVLYEDDNRVTSGLADNSYNLPDRVNQIDYNLKVENIEIFNYYRNLVAIRRLFNTLRMGKATEIKQRMRFLNNSEYNNFKVRIEPTATSPGMTLVFNGTGNFMDYTVDRDTFVYTDNFGMVHPYGVAEIKAGAKRNILPNSVGIFVDKNNLVEFNPEKKEAPNFYEMDWGINQDGTADPDDEIPIPIPIEQDKLVVAVNQVKIREGNTYPVSLTIIDKNYSIDDLVIVVSNEDVATAVLDENEIIITFKGSGKTNVLIYDKVVSDDTLLEFIQVECLATPKSSNLGLILGISIPVVLIASGALIAVLFILKKKKQNL